MSFIFFFLSFALRFSLRFSIPKNLSPRLYAHPLPKPRKKKTITPNSTLGGFLVLLAAATAGLAGAASSAAGTAAALFIARSAAMGSYTALYIYTPEAYPTRVRSIALGLNSSLARIGKR